MKIGAKHQVNELYFVSMSWYYKHPVSARELTMCGRNTAPSIFTFLSFLPTRMPWHFGLWKNMTVLKMLAWLVFIIESPGKFSCFLSVSLSHLILLKRRSSSTGFLTVDSRMNEWMTGKSILLTFGAYSFLQLELKWFGPMAFLFSFLFFCSAFASQLSILPRRWIITTQQPQTAFFFYFFFSFFCGVMMCNCARAELQINNPSFSHFSTFRELKTWQEMTLKIQRESI